MDEVQAPNRINEYGQNVGGLFENAPNAPADYEIARPNTRKNAPNRINEYGVNVGEVFKNAPLPPLMSNELYTIHGNNYKNKQYAQATQVDCVADMKSFQQYSGQCWSDAASIFLLFSKEIGPLMQNFLASPDSVKEYIKWCHVNKEFIEKRIRELPFSNYDEFEQFVFFSSTYLYCLKDRFDTWNANRNNNSEPMTCKLMAFSYCQESVGILAGALLNFSGITWMNITLQAEMRGISIRDYYDTIIKQFREIYNKKNLKKADIKDKFFLKSLGIESRGYDNREFGKVIAVYLQFLKKDIEFETNKAYLRVKLLEEHDKSFFLYDNIASITKFIDLTTVETINRGLVTHMVNMCAQFRVGKGFHVISFLMCENGQQIIYDDNRGSFVEAYWTELYKYIVNPRDKEDSNFIQYYMYHANTKTIEEKKADLKKIVKEFRDTTSNTDDTLQKLERLLSWPFLVALLNPNIICMAYNPKQFILTLLKKHIDGRAVREEVIITQFPSDISELLNTAMPSLKFAGTSIHRLENIPFIYFTPRPGFVMPQQALERIAAAKKQRENAMYAELMKGVNQEAGSRRAKRHARQSRVRRVQRKRKTRRRVQRVQQGRQG